MSECRCRCTEPVYKYYQASDKHVKVYRQEGNGHVEYWSETAKGWSPSVLHLLGHPLYEGPVTALPEISATAAFAIIAVPSLQACKP